MVSLIRATICSVLLLLLVGLGAHAEYRPTDPEYTVVLNVDDGPVIVELNPTFAPATTAQFKRLVREGFYDGLPFYRVIDGFVAQGGDGSDMSEEENAEPAESAGMIENQANATVIRSAHVLADIPEKERLAIEVPDTNSAEFQSMFEARRHRDAEWFVSTPPPVLDVCQVPNQGLLQR